MEWLFRIGRPREASLNEREAKCGPGGGTRLEVGSGRCLKKASVAIVRWEMGSVVVQDNIRGVPRGCISRYQAAQRFQSRALDTLKAMGMMGEDEVSRGKLCGVRGRIEEGSAKETEKPEGREETPDGLLRKGATVLLNSAEVKTRKSPETLK